MKIGHLDPANRYGRLLLQAAEQVTDQRVWTFAALAGAYATVRAVEAYGLWYEYRWAEWFALVSGGLYVPIEVYELFHHPTWLKAAILGVNLLVVAWLAYALRHSGEQAHELRTP
jgi:uncharacterized membrane protein (DUF2068 family)